MLHLTKDAPESHSGARSGRVHLRLAWRTHLLAVSALISVTWATAAGQEAGWTVDDGEALSRFVHETWTVQDGLPVNSINALLQSQDGYLWLATFDGLVRFDGVRFTVYSTGNSEGLPSNRILDLAEARDGSLWIRTQQNHLVRFRDGAFTELDGEGGLGDDAIRVICEDAEGTIWVGTDRGLRTIRDDRLAPVAEGAIRAPVDAILRQEDGALWVGTEGAGVFRYVGDTATAITTPDGPVPGRIFTVYEDPAGSIWVGASSGAYRYRRGALEPLLSAGEPWQVTVREFMVEPLSGKLWIRASEGVYRLEGGEPIAVTTHRQGFDRRPLFRSGPAGHIWFASGTAMYRGGVRAYELGSPRADDPIPVTEIRAFLHDREGSLWIGTNASGLHRLKRALFTVYSEAEGIAYRNIYAIYEDRSGAIWFGTWSRGLSRLSGGTVTSFTRERGYPGYILSLAEDRRGRLWIGGYRAGVSICRLPDLACSLPESGPPNDASVFAIHEDRSGNVWLGTDLGLFRYSSAGWTRLDEKNGAPAAPVRVFEETRDGAVWMGTNGSGLARYRDGRFTNVRQADGIPSDLIRSLYQDEDGWLWVGTEGRGLARIDPERRGSAAGTEDAPAAITVYRAKHGLFDEVIHQILEDDFGRLWMSTNRGIFWVSRSELDAFAAGETDHIHSTGYTEREGLRNREANGGSQPAGIKASDGRLWFPTQDGAAVVDPANLLRNDVPPPVVIEQIVVDGRAMSRGSNLVELNADQRDLRIDYTALSFMAPENMRFRYRLDGYNSDWVEAGNRRAAFYTNVPPGRYSFRVIASNNDGVWNEDGAAVVLAVAPRFYETRTYYLVLLAGLVLLVFAGVRWRIRGLRVRECELSALVDARTEQIRRHEAQLESQNAKLQAQAEKLTELDRAKSRFFANVSHEFRTPLTLTIGPLEDLRSGLYDQLEPEPSRQLEMALRNARRLLRLVNQILDAAKLEAGQMKLRARELDLVAFLRGLADAFTLLADRRRVAINFAAPCAGLLVYFDSSAIEKVFTNLLSNAFKFTPEGGTVSVEIEGVPDGADAGRVVVRVANSGPGIPERELPHVFERFFQVDESQTRLQAGTGIGLSLAKEYLELHGGDIQVESSIGTGTTFTVRLPLGRRHLRDDEIVEEVLSPLPAAAADSPAEVLPDQAELRAALALEAADLALSDGDGEVRALEDRLMAESTVAAAGDSQDVTTVLLVDDHADVRAYIRGHLEANYRVAEAGNGVEGIALARTLLPDLVISDVMMPDTDGYALCRALRSSPETDFIPVILLTAKASSESRIAGLEEGADDYVVKPFHVEELEARVANLIDSRRRLRERFAGTRIELHARDVAVTSADVSYLEGVRRVIEAHLSDETFTVTQLADRVGQDRSHLYRRIKSLLGETPTDLIRRLRLERAAALLGGQAGTVAEVAYAVGFKGVSYFCKCFRDAYGVTPSGYRSNPARELEPPARSGNIL